MPKVVVDGRSLDFRRLGEGTGGPRLVFLHEGLGSVELWRSFPGEVVAGTNGDAIVYSRHGHGWSEPLDAPRTPDFMHREGLVVLPELLTRLDHDNPILIGHSDGASISIIYAGAGHPVAGLVLLAPHVYVEDISRGGLDAAWARFESTDLVARMAKYHAAPESTFRGWGEIWRSPAFRSWNIEEFLPAITCPVLLMQGREDEYGTFGQIEAISRQVPAPVETLFLDDCGHSPHLDRPGVVVDATVDFIRRVASS